MGVHIQPTNFRVSLVPWSDDDLANRLWNIEVSWRGSDRWAVCLSDRCLATDGEWDWEPSPSNRSDEWIATHYYDFATALELAVEKAPEIAVNGVTATEYVNNMKRESEDD